MAVLTTEAKAWLRDSPTAFWIKIALIAIPLAALPWVIG